MERYEPPAVPIQVSLSSALGGTNRQPNGQLSLLPSQRRDPKLHTAGDIALLRQPCVAIVGTRDVTPRGKRETVKLARHLAAIGVVIVSGLAAGVDTAALTAAIESGGRVIGVIGTPLDRVYPAKNRALQETIYRDHLLISQFPSGERVFPSNFPKRNKLMAALSDATAVMEASDASGTLHQAAECTKLRRWLFIAKSVADDPSLTWPKNFLSYATTVVMNDANDIASRLRM